MKNCFARNDLVFAIAGPDDEERIERGCLRLIMSAVAAPEKVPPMITTS